MDIDGLKKIIQSVWNRPPSDKSNRYIDHFFDRELIGKRIIAKVQGNHGIYKVTINVKANNVDSACSCYIGRDGFCHHCSALAYTFLKNPDSFKEIKYKTQKQIRTLEDLESFLKGKTLEMLLKDMKATGITQKAFAESIGMNPGHLTAIKSSELRNRYFNELGATKLACLWVLEHLKPQATSKERTKRA